MVGFRVDANKHIASGHLMRCLSIAGECRRHGEEVIFFMAEEVSPSMKEKLINENMSYIILNSDWQNLDEEVLLLGDWIKKCKVDWLVVDSYYATASYLNSLEKYTRVLYIDDLNKEKYEVSALLRYCQWADDSSYADKYRDSKSILLIGMKYTPLREEFTPSGKKSVESEKEDSILITTGGTDTYNVTTKLLEYMKDSSDFSCFHKYVIIGGMNAYESELKKVTEKDSTVSLHKNVSDIDVYMRKCKFAVSAGGTTLFELCACQTPTVCFSFADNQLDFTRAMGERNIMIFAGDARSEVCIEKNIVSGLKRFKDDAEMTKAFTQKMGELVDGKGALRIAQVLLER